MQKPPATPLIEVRRSPIQGRGVFAARRLRKGMRVIEYTGEPISHDEADARYDDRKGRHHTFLFVLDEETVIDARDSDNPAKYINHSCSPNCETIIDGDEIWVQALRTIQPGEELVYDYRYEWDDEYDASDVRYYGCKCGTEACRGTILRIPRWLKPTAAKWLAGEDVPKPPKPLSQRVKEAARDAKAAQKEARAAEREAKEAAKRAKAAARDAVAAAKLVRKLAKEAERERAAAKTRAAERKNGRRRTEKGDGDVAEANATAPDDRDRAVETVEAGR